MADIAIRQQSPTVLYIRVGPTDNVAIIVNDRGLTVGTRFPDGLILVEHVPQGHKVALVGIPTRSKTIRYGEVIGSAMRDIPQGSWIGESLVELPTVPSLDTLPPATKVPEPLPPLEGYTFEGYRGVDDNVDTKNPLGTTTSVHCVASVVNYVMKITKRDLLPRYPNVDGAVGLNHLYGCGAAINASAAVIPIHAIHNITLNPSFDGEVVVINLGCEELQSGRLLQSTEGVRSIPVDSASVVSLQDERHAGLESMVDGILQVAERHLVELSQRQWETYPASEPVVGMQCGGSDTFSGVTASPAVGYVFDLLVRCGVTVMFSEVIEVRNAIDLLAPRAINEEAGKRLLEEMVWYDNYLDMSEVDHSANPSPGNKKGGLVNVVERALSSIVKPGKSAIVEVFSPGRRPIEYGLTYAATPVSDFVCGIQQIASGITVQVFTIGRGTPYGLMVVPAIKMVVHTELTNRQYDLTNINAGTIATGKKAIEDVRRKLFEFVLDVASGRKKILSDQWGLHDQLTVLNPASVI